MLKLDMNLLWTVVNVLIMYVLLRKFLFKPVQDVIAKRQQMVDASMADAQEAKNKAQAALNAAEDKLHNVDVEAAARREASEQLAEKQKEQLLADAQRQADAIVAEGKAAAEAERASKLRQAAAQSAGLPRPVCAKVRDRPRARRGGRPLLPEAVRVQATSPLPRLLRAVRSFPPPTALWMSRAWTRPFTARSLPLTPVQRVWWKVWNPIIWVSCCSTISRRWAWVLW